MKTVITKEEMTSLEGYGWVNSPILTILKDRGAPINGTLLLLPDEVNYEWVRSDDLEGNVTIEWSEVKK